MYYKTRPAQLRRDVNLFEATVYSIGLIIGAGIYTLIGNIVGLTGNASWMAFLLAAFIAAMTGLSYAELTSIFPYSGSEFNYIRETYKRPLFAFLIGWLLLFAAIFAVSTISLGFSGYFMSLLGLPSASIPLIAIILILALAFLNFLGIQKASYVNLIFTAVEIAGLIIIIVLGLGNLGNISINFFEFPAGTTNIISALLGSTIFVFFAYIGFEEVAHLSEETENPTKTVPRALIISMVVTTILYVLIAIAVAGANIPNLSSYPNPLAIIAQTFLGPSGALILSIIALFAMANTILVTLIVCSRMLYGMAAKGAFHKTLSRIHHKTKTPWIAILITMILSCGFIFLGSIELIAESCVFITFLVFFVINVTLIYSRKTRPKLIRPFRVKPNIGWVPIFPILGAICCFLMLLSYFNNYLVLLIQFIVFLGGLGFYILSPKVVTIVYLTK